MEADNDPTLENTAPPPALEVRWVHGAESLTEIPTTSSTQSASTPASWRAFSDAENERLEKAWKDGLTDEQRTKAEKWRNAKDSGKEKETDKQVEKRGGKEEWDKENDPPGEGKGGSGGGEAPPREMQESDILDPDADAQPHIVPVGLDSLFSVDLLSLTLYPVFWNGTPVSVRRATWFYPAASGSSSDKALKRKYNPVEPALSEQLEKAYFEIKPWLPSYGDELRSVLDIGQEAEDKLKVEMPGVGYDTIFQGPDSARVYTRGISGRLSKTVLTAFFTGTGGRNAGYGGGTVVVRGFFAAKNYKSSSRSGPHGRSPSVSGETTRRGSDVSVASASRDEFRASLLGDGLAGEAHRQRSSSMSGSGAVPSGKIAASGSSVPGTQPVGLGKGAILSDKLASMFTSSATKVGTAAAKAGAKFNGSGNGGEAGDVGSGDRDKNTTQEAIEGDHDTGEGEEAPPKLTELVLVIHGIGQKLAATYDSFSIVHAVNLLRAKCAKHCLEPELVPLVKNRRAQFIPVRWRSSLDFETVDPNDRDDEMLGNRFTLDDIEVKDTIPFVRQLVSGIILDVPFYLSHHRWKMTRAVIRDANRIYRLFIQRNPDFIANGGRVSIIAHSLGSALATDILSNQPTVVKPLANMTTEEQNTTDHLVFNVGPAFFVGSPVGFLFHLNGAQLIARKGKARTKDADPDVALDRAGRYGCMAVDSIYNCYHVLDPVACCLNAVVDARYAKLMKPIAIPTTTTTLLSGLEESFSRVSRMFDSLSLPTFASSSMDRDKTASSVEADKDGKKEKGKQKEQGNERERKKSGTGARPKNLRLPSQIEMEVGFTEYASVSRAAKRFKALNPQGCIDYYLPAEGYIQYMDMLSSHASYWGDSRFSRFIITQLFASEDDQVKTRMKLEVDDKAAASSNSNKK